MGIAFHLNLKTTSKNQTVLFISDAILQKMNKETNAAAPSVLFIPSLKRQQATPLLISSS